MENEKTLLELIDGLKAELNFLPPDDNIREGFLTVLKFVIVAL